MCHVALYTFLPHRTRNVIFLAQAGTGNWQTLLARTRTQLSLSVSPSPQTTKIRACQRKKVCYGIDQNPSSQQTIYPSFENILFWSWAYVF